MQPGSGKKVCRRKRAGGGEPMRLGLALRRRRHLWRGGAIDQPEEAGSGRGHVLKGGLEELPRRRQAQREAGLEVPPKGGGVQGKVGFRGRWGLGSRPHTRRGSGGGILEGALLGRRATEEARSEQALGGAKPALADTAEKAR